MINRFSGFLSLFILLQTISAYAQSIADTSGFTADNNGIPTSASTMFHLPFWTAGDAIDTAHHELLHAIGFAVAYNYFGNKVNERREFCDTPTDPCKILAKLVPADQGTHVDPTAGTVNGYDQSKSVMQPTRVDGQRMDGQEQSVLNSAFDWPSHKIKITISYQGSFDNTQKSYVQNAVDSAMALFGASDAVNLFVWTVSTDQVAARDRTMTPPSQTSTANLVNSLKTAGPPERLAISNAILDRGYAALPGLKAAGAKPMTNISPPMSDILYTLITRRLEGRIRTTSFGLHVESGTTREKVLEIGGRWGFILRDSDRFDPSMSPSCYVTLVDGMELLAVMESLVRNEPAIKGVNFNNVE